MRSTTDAADGTHANGRSMRAANHLEVCTAVSLRPAPAGRVGPKPRPKKPPDRESRERRRRSMRRDAAGRQSRGQRLLKPLPGVGDEDLIATLP